MKKTSGSRAQGGARCDRSQQQRHEEGGMMALVGQELELGTGSRIWRISLPTEMGSNPRRAVGWVDLELEAGSLVLDLASGRP